MATDFDIQNIALHLMFALMFQIADKRLQRNCKKYRLHDTKYRCLGNEIENQITTQYSF